jgi:hypothetical protein
MACQEDPRSTAAGAKLRAKQAKRGRNSAMRVAEGAYNHSYRPAAANLMAGRLSVITGASRHLTHSASSITILLLGAFCTASDMEQTGTGHTMQSEPLLTASLTVITGLIILVFGQLVEKFFIEPLLERSRTLGKISFALIYYANVYSNPGFTRPEQADEASKNLRNLAAKLISTTYAVNGYSILSLLRIVPSKGNVHEATHLLIGLSNAVYLPNPISNADKPSEIARLLRIGAL